MRATQLITKLAELIYKHGDLDVVNYDGDQIEDVEFNADEGACFVVTFE